MAWPYDLQGGGGYSTPQLTGITLGNYGSSVPYASDNASGAQNIASLFSGTGGQTPSPGAGTAAAGNAFSSLSNLFGGDGFFSKNSIFGGTDTKTGVTTKGWAPTALGIGQAIFSGIQGQQATKLANKQFDESKRQFDLNYGAQRQSLNTQLEDRQRARVASNPGAYESVSDYLSKNRIK